MYCLYCTITEHQREIADAVGYGHGAEGCVEEPFGQHIKLTLYFSQNDDARAAAASFVELLSIDTPIIEHIPDGQDWNAKWRESMEPAEIAEGVWVSPVWLEPPQVGRKAWIKIEPKMAFGTGHHETTRLAAQELIAQAKFIAGKDILDIGTGSGVLCFVADYAGAKSALGIEIDRDCRENLAENLRDNPARDSGSVRFIIGTTDAINTNCNQKFDAIIMNMLPTESIPLLEQVNTMIRAGGILIWSGILIDDLDEVIDTAANFGFKLTGSRTENEWWCGTFA